MKPIKFNQDVTATVKHNYVEVTTFVDWQQSINENTVVQVPQPVITRLDINSKEFWELVKHAALKLRLMYTPITKQYELSMVVSEAAIAIQNTMDE